MSRLRIREPFLNLGDANGIRKTGVQEADLVEKAHSEEAYGLTMLK